MARDNAKVTAARQRDVLLEAAWRELRNAQIAPVVADYREVSNESEKEWVKLGGDLTHYRDLAKTGYDWEATQAQVAFDCVKAHCAARVRLAAS